MRETAQEDAETTALSGGEFHGTSNEINNSSISLTGTTTSSSSRPMEHDEKYAEQKLRAEFAGSKQFIRHCIKHWLYLWEKQVGGADPSTLIAYKDTLRKMKPFFKRLNEGEIDSEMMERLESICTFCQEREYVLANEEYLKVSIGSATWPMGATMVGIHERAGRDKIASDKIAHIMNDEVTRSYLHGIKRLISFAQSKYPTAPSKMIKF